MIACLSVRSAGFQPATDAARDGWRYVSESPQSGDAPPCYLPPESCVWQTAVSTLALPHGAPRSAHAHGRRCREHGGRFLAAATHASARGDPFPPLHVARPRSPLGRAEGRLGARQLPPGEPVDLCRRRTGGDRGSSADWTYTLIIPREHELWRRGQLNRIAFVMTASPGPRRTWPGGHRQAAE